MGRSSLIVSGGRVLTPAATVRRVFNMTALACVEAQIRAQATARE